MCDKKSFKIILSGIIFTILTDIKKKPPTWITSTLLIIKSKLSIIYLDVHTEEIKSIFQFILQSNDSL